MNKTPLISCETLKTISQGALGAMTFGAFHQYTTNKIMELHNEKIELQHQTFMDKMKKKRLKWKINMKKKRLKWKINIKKKRLKWKINIIY